jgi:serine/threonine protein kinase
VRLNPDLSPKLEDIINKCLEKDRNLRYQHASDIHTDLQRLKRDTESGRTAATPLIGKVLEKLLESNAPSFLEKLDSTLSEWLITAGVALLLFFLSIPAAKKIDEMFLGSYKRLLQRLVANRVTTYWATYNSLLRIFAGCQAKIAEYKNALLAAEGRVRPPDDKKAS